LRPTPGPEGAASLLRSQWSALALFGQPGPPLIFNLFQATANVAYSPDVFGGKRRQIESTQAQADYQRFVLEASYLTLAAGAAQCPARLPSRRASA
jgi:outer membrane protein TolC